MAKGNMVLTLVAQTRGFSKNIRNAGKDILSFGSIAKSGFGLAIAAIGGLATALFTFIPNLVAMAEESRKSELRLGNIAKQMGLFGDNTDTVTKRMSKYAESLSFATGVDDELIKSSESILLTFKEIAKSADVAGGAFDRATKATIDLAAAGFGNAEDNAKQLGKALNDPVKGLTSLTKSGVTFTKKEREKIKALTESGKLLEAQDVILSAIEMQVGGTAEATASSMDRMQQRFEAVGEELGTALLPAVDDLAAQMIEWLDSVEGKKAIEDLTGQLEDFGAWITSPGGNEAVKDLAESLATLAAAAIATGQGMQSIYEAVKAFTGIPRWLLEMLMGEVSFTTLRNNVNRIQDGPTTTTGNTSAPGGPRPRSITVNVAGITPSATVGRTVINAIKNAERIGIR